MYSNQKSTRETNKFGKKKKKEEVTGSPADEGFPAEHEGACLCAKQDIYQVVNLVLCLKQKVCSKKTILPTCVQTLLSTTHSFHADLHASGLS